MDLDKMLDELVQDEAVRLRPYRDTVGKLTIGIGRNLDDKGITAEEARYLALNDVAEVLEALRRRLPWFGALDEVRQRVLVNMGFNLGVEGLLGFRNTLAHVEAGRFAEAADNMLLSKWATQVGIRARRLATMMRTGEDRP